jgi:hypothetical protein
MSINWSAWVVIGALALLLAGVVVRAVLIVRRRSR